LWHWNFCVACVCSTPPSSRDRRLRDSGFFPKTLEACVVLILMATHFLCYRFYSSVANLKPTSVISALSPASRVNFLFHSLSLVPVILFMINLISHVLPSVLWHCWKRIWPVKNWVMTDEVLAALSVSVWGKVQMICVWSIWGYCHPIVSCFIKIEIGLTFLVPAYPGCRGKEAAKQMSVSSHTYQITDMC